MKRNVSAALSFAFGLAFAAQFISSTVQAQSPSSGDAAVTEMVPAQVALAENVDSNKTKPGDQIRTTLSDKVKLKDGTELPAGTAIIGIVSTDEMQLTGTSKLAINFNKAVLKNGTVIAIKATIVGVNPPEHEDASGRPIKPGDQYTQSWSGRPDSVDEIGALPGVDLHSKVSSKNSGVLVATGKHDVKLKWGSEISLAVVAADQAHHGE
jgi:hypothetical protein